MSRSRLPRYTLADWFRAGDAAEFRDVLGDDEDAYREFIRLKKAQHRALEEECERAGLPIGDVRHYWFKSEEFSIFSKMPQSNGNEKVRTWMDEQLDRIDKISTPRDTKGSGTIVVGMSDFHFGANVKAYLNSPAFNADVIIKRIKACVGRINAIGARKVHLVLAGDFIESFTGVNHDNSWQELDMFGANAFIFTTKVMRELLFKSINNLERVYMVAGNHDRVTPKSTLDARGDFASMLAYHLGETMDVPVEFDHLVLNPDIDNVRYVIMHGHHGLSKQSIYKLLFDYGSQSSYNVIMEGHWHSRQVRKALSSKATRVVDDIIVELDNGSYRKITLPSMFTGNFYSLSNGFSSSAGFAWTQRYENGIDHHDCQA